MEKQKKDTEEWEEMTAKVDDLTKKVAEYMEDDNARGRSPQPMVKTTQQPTKEEHQRHQLTHTPCEPWCRHCAAARAVRTQHKSKGRNAILVPDIEKGTEGPTTISMDYMFLHDRGAEQANPPHLVVVEHKHGRAWAYRVPNKGIMGGAYWLPKRLASDWDNNGMKDAVIQLETDQEPAIVTWQAAIQEVRKREVILANS